MSKLKRGGVSAARISNNGTLAKCQKYIDKPYRLEELKVGRAKEKGGGGWKEDCLFLKLTYRDSCGRLWRKSNVVTSAIAMAIWIVAPAENVGKRVNVSAINVPFPYHR